MDIATPTPTLQGTIIKGRERISSREAMTALGCETKQTRPLMHSLGWEGPIKARVTDASGKITVAWCYERDRQSDNSVDTALDNSIDELPRQLEEVTRDGLKALRKVLRAPFDAADSALTRSQVTAALGAINAQLRADEQRLRTKTTGDVLAKLLKIIENERQLEHKPVEAVRDDHPSDQGAEHQQSQALTIIDPLPE